MDDLDFSKKPAAPAEATARAAAQSAAQSPLYNPALALEFFRAAGTLEAKPGGKPVFAENEKAGGLFSKGARMYLLVEGEIGLMIVALKPGQTATQEELLAFCRERLAKYKIPKRVEFAEALPYSPYGKVLKAELRKQFVSYQ